jgi:hypothetical protein
LNSIDPRFDGDRGPLPGELRALGAWTDVYNLTKLHSALSGITPFQRLNSLLRNDTWTWGLSGPELWVKEDLLRLMSLCNQKSGASVHLGVYCLNCSATD